MLVFIRTIDRTDLYVAEDFNLAMYRSGHTQKFRMQITDAVVGKYKNKVQTAKEQRRPLYRDRVQILEEKYKKKKNKKFWFKELGFTATLNIPMTPGGVLKKNILRSLSRQDLGPEMRLMLREVPGPQVGNLLSNVTAHNKTDRCGRPDCFPCGSSAKGSGGACWARHPTYKVVCSSCEGDGQAAVYTGESGYSAYTRGGLHRGGLVAENHRHPLWEHCVNHHGARAGEGVQGLAKFRMQVTGSHKTACRRLISEAVQIEDEVRQAESSRESGGRRIVMNSISQWFQPKLIRVRAGAGLFK